MSRSPSPANSTADDLMRGACRASPPARHGSRRRDASAPGAARPDCRADRHSRPRPARPTDRGSSGRVDRGVAAIGELFERPLTAIGTGDPHRRPQCRLGCAPMPFSSITRACREAVEPIGGGDRMRLVLGDEMGKAQAGGRRRLEAAIAPAGIEIEPVDRRPVDDRRAVHRHVHQPAPGAQRCASARSSASAPCRLRPRPRPPADCRAGHRNCSRRCRRRTPARPCPTG